MNLDDKIDSIVRKQNDTLSGLNQSKDTFTKSLDGTSLGIKTEFKDEIKKTEVLL